MVANICSRLKVLRKCLLSYIPFPCFLPSASIPLKSPLHHSHLDLAAISPNWSSWKLSALTPADATKLWVGLEETSTVQFLGLVTSSVLYKLETTPPLAGEELETYGFSLAVLCQDGGDSACCSADSSMVPWGKPKPEVGYLEGIGAVEKYASRKIISQTNFQNAR